MAEVVISPRVRGFICLTTHPEGCAANVREQVSYVSEKTPGEGLKNVLVVGSGTGYGLASLLNASFGYNANTLGVCFEKEPSEKRPGTAGWYNLAEAHRLAKEQGKLLETINGDAFSHEIKQQVIAALKERFGKLDMVVYSLASPKRKDPDSDTVWSSVLKPIGETFSGKTIDLREHQVTTASIDPANDDEIANTSKVMGGDDWQLWIDALAEADLLADGFRTVAYSYIGPEVTYPIYRSGTIGNAKEHLESTGKALNERLQSSVNGSAWVSVNKALVTQASSAIPVVPLYIGILYKIMKEKGTHEGCIEQITRLFNDHIGPGATPTLDDASRIRIDDWEMAEDVQAAVKTIWDEINTDNLNELSDYQGYQDDFLKLFGFGRADVDYDAPTEVVRTLA